VTQEWVSRYNGPGYSYDYSKSLVVDNSGNVYITGWSTGNGTYYDYATIKYNSAGVQQWVQRYDGPGNDTDYVRSIAVDGQGNVYVTGGSIGNGTGYDYATIKYNSAGVQQWVARYNGPGNGNDEAYSLAVDDSGNVYITGKSIGIGTNSDYATIKYNSSGVLQWVSRYNGPGNSNDEASSIAVDDSNNVYVTGGSTGNGTGSDYATIKYNSSGIQQWVSRYGGGGSSNDAATSIAVDDSGNVYVTGWRGAVYNSCYCTIKYDYLGVQQWIKTYTEQGAYYATSIAVDDSGNVYVTGGGWEGCVWTDYATIKYNSAGVQQWIKIYGLEDVREIARSIAVDSLGNVYITGSGYTTIKYNSSGVQQWIKKYGGSGEGVVVDISGNVYVTGSKSGSGTSSDYATIKYNSSGDTLWVSSYNGPGSNADDEAYKLLVDGSGNVYVTGRSYGSGTDYDYATVKYNLHGVQQWSQRYNGPGNGNDSASSLAVDSSGNVYVTGISIGIGTGSDYATIKYNSLGVQQWVSRYNGPTFNTYEVATSIAVDNLGNVYVTGISVGNGTNRDYTTIKYNSLGTQQWVERYLGLYSNSGDYATSIAVDDSGNVYVTGSSGGDIATIKYNSTGVQQWVSRYNGPENGSDGGNSMVLDDSGNVYVTGYSYSDYATIKYNSNGDSLWIARYNGPGNLFDEAYSLAVDALGNVYVTGVIRAIIGSGTDYGTIKYNSSGDSLWVREYNGPHNHWDYATSIAVDEQGNAYVTGYTQNGYQDYDYTTIKYNPFGVQLWIQNYNGPGTNNWDIARSIAVDGSGNVYVTGRSDGPGTGFDFTTIKYSQSPPPIPNAPVLVSPTNGATLVELNPLLDWDNSLHAESYRVQVSTDSLISSTVYDSSGIPFTEFQIPNNGLNINTTYYWRVNATNGTGTSPWSTVFHFTTGVTNISQNNEIQKEFKLYNSYPKIKTLVKEKVNSGRYEKDWDGAGYPSGVYFYKMVTDDYVDVKRMILIK